MSRTMLRKLLCLVALALSGVLTTLQAQTTTFVSPVPFYRFRDYTNPANGLSYCSTYRNHGSICKLLQNNFGSFAFTTPASPPPPPPPDDGGNTCSAGLALKSKCAQLGGSWNDETCSCDQF